MFDIEGFSPKALSRMIRIQAEKIKNQQKELASLKKIHEQDAANTEAWQAFKFFIKCLMTKRTYGRK